MLLRNALLFNEHLTISFLDIILPPEVLLAKALLSRVLFTKVHLTTAIL